MGLITKMRRITVEFFSRKSFNYVSKKTFTCYKCLPIFQQLAFFYLNLNFKSFALQQRYTYVLHIFTLLDNSFSIFCTKLKFSKFQTSWLVTAVMRRIFGPNCLCLTTLLSFCRLIHRGKGRSFQL